MSKLSLVAVTACVSGVAHTYMAAEQLEKLAQKHGFRIKIETQGALGTENALSEEDIASADLAIIICDISIEGMERFSRCRQVKMNIQKALVSPDTLIAAIERARVLPLGSVVEPK